MQLVGCLSLDGRSGEGSVLLELYGVSRCLWCQSLLLGMRGEPRGASQVHHAMIGCGGSCGGQRTSVG